MANHREGLRGVHRTLAKRADRADEIDTLLATPIDQSPLYDPARRDRRPASGRARAAHRSRDHPAMRSYRDFLRPSTRARRTDIGVWRIRTARTATAPAFRHDRLALTADSIHAIGLLAVDQLEDIMRAIAIRSFGTSDVSRLLERLRTDTAFTFHTRDDAEHRP